VNKIVRAAACAALLLSACGPEAPVAPAGRAAPSAPKSPASGATATASALAGPGAPAHDLYAARSIGCDACHPCGKRIPGGHAQPWMDAASAGFHALSANSGLQGCTLCHGPSLDGVGGTVSISCAQCHGASWRTDCTLCHGGADGAAPPTATWGRDGDPVRVGAHQAHLRATHGLSRPVACETCHVVPADALSPGHADGPTADVTFSGLAGAGGAWNRAEATCASTYCHAGRAGGTVPAPTWTRTDGADRACTACHGAPPPAPAHPENADCAACHPGYTSSSVDPATHVNGLVEVDGAGVTCSSCHGGAQNPAPPRGTRGEVETTTLAVGAHQRHVLGGAASGPIACDACHFGHVPAENRHANGAVEVAFSPAAGGAAAQWDRTTATCASTACHGAATPVWTAVTPGPSTCSSCHGAPPAAPHTQNPACGNCHDGYTATSVNPALHLNGTPDVRPLQCNSCHGSLANDAPPLGTGGETETSQRAVGAHQAHIVAGTLAAPVACTECHLVPSTLVHSDGNVRLDFGPAARRGGTVPAYDPVTGTCASTYCHGATLRSAATGDPSLHLAPLWTGGAGEAACGACHLLPPPQPHPRTQLCDGCHPGYSLTGVNPVTHIDGVIQAENLSCSVCHGDDTRVLVSGADGLALAAPPFGTRGETETTSRAVGAHQAHVNRGDGMALPAKCVTCHAVPALGAYDHADGSTVLHFGALATMNGATPAFDGQTCTNTYCHGSTMNRGGTDHSPTWAAPGPLACTTCHGAPPPLPHPQDPDCLRCHPGYTATSARKATHVNGISDFPSSCNACHDSPPNSGEHYEHIQEGISCDRCHTGYTRTTANETLHRNARQDVTVGGWDASRRTCSSANGCHDSEYWGRSSWSQTTGCNRCHGSPPSSGEHREHSEYACSRCHGTGYSKTTVNAAMHMSGTVDVPFSWYSRATLTCDQACHGDERWGSRGQVTANCNACHGFPPVAPHPQKTACHDCHTSMNPDGTLTASHNDGTLDVSGQGCASCHGYPPVNTRTGALHTTDQNCYGCHATTVDANNAVVPNGTHNDGAVQVGGGGVGTYGCQICHGDQARTIVAGGDPHVKSAPPYGTRGEVSTAERVVGAHLAHLNKPTGLAKPLVCGECHPVPTAMDHANGSTVFAFGALARADGAAPVFQTASLTCASTYCHGATMAGGSNTTPLWTGGPSQAACGTCHGAPPPAPHTTNTNCGGCHQGYTATTVNAALHVDGKTDTNAQTCGACHAIPPPAPHTTSTACGSCHPGYTATTVNETIHNDGTVDVANLGCTACHGNAALTATAAAPLGAAPPVDTLGGSTGLRVGAHQKHLVGGVYANAFACTTCHAGVGGYASGHSNGTNDVGFTGAANTNLRKGSWTPRSGTSAGNCGSTWCHGAVINRSGGTSGGTATTPTWTGTITTCTACHAVTRSSLPNGHTRSDHAVACSVCHGTGYTSTTGSPPTGNGVNKATHVDGIKTVVTRSSGTGIRSWNPTTRTCTASCHGSETW